MRLAKRLTGRVVQGQPAMTVSYPEKRLQNEFLLDGQALLNGQVLTQDSITHCGIIWDRILGRPVTREESLRTHPACLPSRFFLNGMQDLRF